MNNATQRYYNPFVPTHVPRELVLDFNVFSPTASDSEDVFEAFQQMLTSGVPDIFWTRHNGGHWVVTRADYIREVYLDYQTFSNIRYIVPKEHNVAETAVLPVTTDPPEHTAYRSIVNPGFSPRSISQISDDIRARADSLIDGFFGKGFCEFIEDFALRLPIDVFLRLCAIPVIHRELLVEIVDAGFTGRATPAESLGKLQEYLAPIFEHRRHSPGDDVLSLLTRARFKGRPLSDSELQRFGTTLLNAGLDSVASVLGMMAQFLAQHPEHRRLLIASPSLVPRAVEEFVRRFPTNTAGPSRRVKRDTNLHGVLMKAEDYLVAPRPFATLDSREFPDPMQVDFQRPNLHLHQGFGTGPHRCLGSFLARTELKIFLEAWLARIPDFEIKPGFQVKWDTGRHSSVRELPLRWPT